MKTSGILCLVAVLAVLLTGCGAAPAEESVKDDTRQAASTEPRYDISVAVPADTQAVSALSTGVSQLYSQEEGGFTLITQTLAAESLDLLLQDITGLNRDDLTVITTWQGGMPRHDLSWVTAGEEGLELCRGVVIDDGRHYYTVITAAPEALAQDYNQQIVQCLDTVRLTENQNITEP